MARKKLRRSSIRKANSNSSASSFAGSPLGSSLPPKFPDRTVDAVAYGWKLAVPRLVRELDCDVSNSQICMHVNVATESSVQCVSLMAHANKLAQQNQLIKTEAAKGVTALANLSKRLQEHLVISLAHSILCHGPYDALVFYTWFDQTHELLKLP